jgi:transcriptional regulator GlxA family with amidase domain
MAALFGGLAARSTAEAAADPSKSTLVAALPRLGKPLHPPAKGLVNVAFVIGPDLVLIDVFGPMAAFGDAGMASASMNPLFNIYTVAATTDPVDADGLKLQSQYSFKNAPQPHVLVVPAQKNLPATVAYVKEAGPRADVTMSVCTGAFLAARAGLFDGLKATTHHGGYDSFEQMFPKVTLVRGPRYVENPTICASGGESCGIELALRVVERYYGTDVAKAAAWNMEYRRTPRPQSINDV